MDLGVALPTSGPLASPEAILRVAQEAESLGYTAVWTYERLLYAIGDIDQGYGAPRPLPGIYKSAYEPIETLAWVAARTERIKLGTSVVDAPFHTPVGLARRFATLDRLSGGRAIAGLGQGWMQQEFQAANVSRKLRGPGVEEFVAAMRAAWGPDPVSFEGRHYRIPESLINPKPQQQGGIPILLGSMAPPAIERAARIADGLNPIAFSPRQLTAAVSSFRSAAEAHGRDPSALQVVVRANVPLTADPLPEDSRPYLGGSASQIAKDLEALEPLALDQVMFNDGASSSPDEALERLGELRAAVG
ncbi:MAG TPA: TIGR03619 family F420-dependent LLM class oxidoreductase [Actinomycetes bacterium]|jgi:probable F420-dependent oxidoreductase|nr:TIGR03619 family F420-dependent LLM class oxidoreductase [Actinomycetes bacterium]